MRRYLVETCADTSADDLAVRIAVRRFPEITVERRYEIDDEIGSHELWVCRAPSDVHIRRWTAAAHLVIRDITEARPVTPNQGG